MRYTVVCVHILKDAFPRDACTLDFEPAVVHVEADNMQEAEMAAAADLAPVRTDRLRFLAVFEGHLTDLKSASTMLCGD